LQSLQKALPVVFDSHASCVANTQGPTIAQSWPSTAVHFRKLRLARLLDRITGFFKSIGIQAADFWDTNCQRIFAHAAIFTHGPTVLKTAAATRLARTSERAAAGLTGACGGAKEPTSGAALGLLKIRLNAAQPETLVY
jgi:hypothetical protein